MLSFNLLIAAGSHCGAGIAAEVTWQHPQVCASGAAARQAGDHDAASGRGRDHSCPLPCRGFLSERCCAPGERRAEGRRAAFVKLKRRIHTARSGLFSVCSLVIYRHSVIWFISIVPKRDPVPVSSPVSSSFPIPLLPALPCAKHSPSFSTFLFCFRCGWVWRSEAACRKWFSPSTQGIKLIVTHEPSWLPKSFYEDFSVWRILYKCRNTRGHLCLATSA